MKKRIAFIKEEFLDMLHVKGAIKRLQRGFTLLEVLLVVAVIAILAGIVIIAINPNKNLGDTRNSQRQTDVTTILNAVYQYSLDNNGALPSGITLTATEVCRTGAGSCAGLVDLSVLTAAGKYLVAIPADPQCPTVCNANGVGYEIRRDANSRLIVNAPDAEQGKTISVNR
ncbi:MAG TPA: prepilin-type N-terminal cleavage/methylation domain-containing protein [Candidatus Saccharimonadales bacterium]|nr:prepilin-type N-terminal cleavage/methylation domain-containing protein [Candidatus Saccharimonadales bacterium]